MSVVVISLFFTIGAATWIYAKIQRNTGNNTKSSLIVTGIAAVMLFVFCWSLLSLFIK